MSKRERLRMFLEDVRTLPAPNGSHTIRPYIGGSEMHKAIRTKNPASFVTEKIDGFDGNIHTKFGNVFENVSKCFLSKIFNEEITTPQSIPGMHNAAGDVIQVYTPDGLMVTETAKLNEFLAQFDQSVDSKEQEMLVLLEFKSPTKRIPTPTWTSRTEGYRTQVLTGLDTIKIVDVGLYVDVSYRLCEFSQLAKGNYDYVPIASQTDAFSSVICYGMLGFYEDGTDKSFRFDVPYTTRTETKKKLMDTYREFIGTERDTEEVQEAFIRSLKTISEGDIYDYLLENTYDLSKLDECVLEDTFQRTMYKPSNVGWLGLHMSSFNGNAIDYIAEFKEKCKLNNWKPVAVAPWKMFHMNCITVDKQPNFLENHREKLTYLHSVLMESILHKNASKNE